MAIIARKPLRFDRPSEGWHEANLVEVQEANDIVSQFDHGKRPRPKVFLVFRIQEGEDGAVQDVPHLYTRSLHPKARLFQHLQSWLGLDDDVDEFDLEQLVGRRCRILVKHRKSSRGRIFAKVANIAPSTREKQNSEDVSEEATSPP